MRGGIRLVQIRCKGAFETDMVRAIVARVRNAGGITIVNDDIALARLADGVHLGQEDAAGLDLRAVRAELAGRIIGLSCGTPAEAGAADPGLIDYLGVGPIFPSPSKSDAGPPIGVNGVRAVVEATDLPCAAIGGIALGTLRRVRESGAVMAAVIGALICEDVEGRARAFVRQWNDWA